MGIISKIKMNSLFTINFPLWIFLIPFAVILLSGAKISRRGKWQEDSLSLSHSKDLLGFFALMIVVHHIVQALIQNRDTNVGIMVFYENMGVCFVGGFFLFSGYGLLKSLYAKKDYLDNFFKKRILKILIPFYTVNTFFAVVTKNMGMLDPGEVGPCMVGIILPNDHMWYLVEIVVLYSLFYKNFKNPKSEKAAFIKMFADTVILIAISFIFGHGPFWFQGEWWYNSTILFFLGMILARFEAPVISFAKRYYAVLTVLMAALFAGLYKLTVSIINARGYWTEFSNKTWGQSNLDKLEALSAQVPMIICFVILFLLIGLKLKTSNRVLHFLGTISLDLYITHRLCIWVFDWIKSPAMYMLTVLVCSLILGSIFHVIILLVTKAVYMLPFILGKIATLIIRAVSVITDRVHIKKHSTWGIIFVAPFTVFYLIFSFVPIVSTIINSFFENFKSGLKQIGPTFVGLANYQKLFADGDFWQYLGNTMLLWIIIFIPQIILSLLLASWFSDSSMKIKGAGFFKTVIYLPSVLMASAFASLFIALFSKMGPINDLFVDTLKIWPERVDFLSHIWPTRGLIIFMSFLMWFGGSTLLLMAGMMNIDSSLYEAARVDGAGRFLIFRKITMPGIRPVFVYVVITSLISGVQLFDVPFILTQGSGGPVRTSMTMVMFLKNHLYSKNYGMSGAISTLMLFVTGALSVIVFIINRKAENK